MVKGVNEDCKGVRGFFRERKAIVKSYALDEIVRQKRKNKR